MQSSSSCFSSDYLPTLKFLGQKTFALKSIKTEKAATFVVVVIVIDLIICLKFGNAPLVFNHFDLGHIFVFFKVFLCVGDIPRFHDEASGRMKPEKAQRQVESRCRQLFIRL